MEVINHYQQQYQELSSQDSDSVKSYRQQAWETFSTLRFPTLKAEDWKYTSTAALQKLLFALTTNKTITIDWQQVSQRLVLPQAKHLIVLVDGQFNQDYSIINQLPGEITLKHWAHINETEKEMIQKEFAQLHHTDGLSALNGALLNQGIFINVMKDCVLAEPILLVHVTTQAMAANYAAQHITVGENAKVTVVEQYISLTDESYLNSVVHKYILDSNASLNYVKLQQEGNQGFHLSYTDIDQSHESYFHGSYFALSGQWGRNNISTRLMGKHAHATVNGMYHITHKSLQDFHTLIHHQVADCSSSELFKGVLDGAGRAVFNGRIVVDQDAQHTESQQANHNLILSDQAEVDTKPQLEIFADDVKCAHGTTIGQINEEQWFYLCSRGIDKELAKKMLIEGFFIDVAGQINDTDLKQTIANLLRESLNV
ncbi:MAG: Fe-S cluster assembly protein SufD [Betaproteobacteria bacterium]|nr:Fe-S cluster assembly protein SufD [Betaproteobacteria bacterium]